MWIEKFDPTIFRHIEISYAFFLIFKMRRSFYWWCACAKASQQYQRKSHDSKTEMLQTAFRHWKKSNQQRKSLKFFQETCLRRYFKAWLKAFVSKKKVRFFINEFGRVWLYFYIKHSYWMVRKNISEPEKILIYFYINREIKILWLVPRRTDSTNRFHVFLLRNTFRYFYTFSYVLYIFFTICYLCSLSGQN